MAGAPLRPSPVFAAPFHLGDQPPRAGGADAYARTEHPTLRDFEAAVGELDGGRCLSFATGMAAITAAVLPFVGSGDRVVLPSDGYYTTRLLAADELARFGVRVEYVPTLEIEAVAARGDLDGARLVLLETPSNPAARRLRHRRRRAGDPGRRRAARRRQHDRDAAGAAPAGAGRRPHRGQRHEGAHRAQRPAARPRQHHRRRAVRPDGELARSLRQHAGAVRGLARPPLDEHAGPPAGRQAANAAAVAEVLAGSPAVRGVRWPWRPGGSVLFALAARQMLRPNGSCPPSWPTRPPGGGAGRRPAVDRGDQLRRRAQHDRPPRPVGRRRVAPGFVRLSCGIEDTDDLVADLSGALDGLA